MTCVHNARHKKNLILYFQVHQPSRLRNLRFLDIGSNLPYFDDKLNEAIIQRVATQCYAPANELLLKTIRQHPNVKVCFSVSGIAIDQLQAYAPETLASFRALADTGCVEFLAETYYHSLASVFPGNDFELQVARHQREILRHFGISPKVFRNTELIYHDELGKRISQLGFSGTIIDGADRILHRVSPHHVFIHPETDLRILTRNYRLSDDIAFRFIQDGTTLSTRTYIDWLRAIPADQRTATIAMDYETFGEHYKTDSGILSFLREFLTAVAADDNLQFTTPSEAIKSKPYGTLSVPVPVSWADEERDLSAWLGNEMQRDAFDSLAKLEKDVKDLCDKELLHEWRMLQTSDHFYYMSTKRGSDGQVHSYFSPYPSPYEAFINFMNVLADFTSRVKRLKSAAKENSSIPVTA